MLKKFSLILTLFAVMPAVCMEYVIRVPKTTIKITTQDNQEFEVDKEQAKCSETLKNLIVGDADDDADSEAFRDGIPLPNITGPIWAKIQELLPLVLAFNKPVGDDLQEEAKRNAQQEKEKAKASIIEKLKSYDGATLIEFIAALNYLDIHILLDLAIDVAKQMDIKEVTFAQIATLPWPICKSIVLGQMARTFGPLPGKQLAICNGHTGSVSSVCISQDGNTIVSGSDDNTFREWHMQGNQLDIRNGLTNPFLLLRPLSDRKRAVGFRNRTIEILDVQYNQLAAWTHTDTVSSICITQDNKIVSGSVNGTICVWDMQGNQLAQCNGHTGLV